MPGKAVQTETFKRVLGRVLLYVTPRDVQEVFLRIIGHRLLLSPRAEAENVNVQNILREILEAVPAPVLR